MACDLGEKSEGPIVVGAHSWSLSLQPLVGMWSTLRHCRPTDGNTGEQQEDCVTDDALAFMELAIQQDFDP
ncbi:hypothetical protein SAY87_029750 [Trapa incisa]|uniref:Uncharacterized protein n=1 Tax=Trapa incisa TaxID=236973 RepID=A0AAN7Q980_9MYRT|nr:hypothetical protein SAY87_029750 [Trapa incisa]